MTDRPDPARDADPVDPTDELDAAATIAAENLTMASVTPAEVPDVEDAEVPGDVGLIDHPDDAIDDDPAPRLEDEDGLDADGAVVSDDVEPDDYDAAVATVAGTPVPATSSAARRRAGQHVPDSRSTPTPSQLAVHVRENVSSAFVIVSVAVFAAILLNGILLGNGGLITGQRTQTPTASASASPSASASGSPAVSGSPAASASASASVAPSASPSVVASPSVAPSP